MNNQPTFDDVTADRIPSGRDRARSASGWARRKFTEHYAYLALHPRHVNLGFNQGAELPDPAGLLGGPGAKLRHLKLTSVDQLTQPGIRELLIAARAHRLATQGSADS